MDYQKYLIAKRNHWSVYVHQNQCYLGRLYVAAHSEGDRDLFDMTVAEREEFFDVGKKVKKALTEVFNPDRLNYVNLQNEWHHLHVHVIPRYEKPRTFDGVTFVDERWGKNYAPYNKEFTVPETTLLKICDVLKEKLRGGRTT